MNKYVSLINNDGVLYALTEDGLIYEIWWNDNTEQMESSLLIRLPQFIERAA